MSLATSDILPIADVSKSTACKVKLATARQESSQSIEEMNDVKQALNTKGYELVKQITRTSQGSVWRAIQQNTLQQVVIKIAAKKFVDSGYGIVSSTKRIKLEENIVSEADILRKVTMALNDEKYEYIAHSVVKYIDFFSDLQSYFLVTSNGGQCLQKFVEKCHELIFAQRLEIKEWRAVVQLIFKQMIDFVDFLHHQMNICHMDICLKNILIKNVVLIPQNDGKVRISRNFQVAFIDFGVALTFFGDCMCSKYVGKTRFVSPELFCKSSPFDARANEVWSLAVCLFTLSIGHSPYNCPSGVDYQFGLIKNGKLSQLLVMMNKEWCVTAELMDLLRSMFKVEAERITLAQIKNHSFLRI